ncbi:MAG TPA: anti-sigma factor [Opitutaceae bacterium]|jgi:anti-sigma-K factor RskA|nr:anti-sigma factor [Opitutaceae bacterium]
MIDERHEEFASLYAFGLLEGAELAAFEAELVRDAELRRYVAELRETAAALAHAAPPATPPPALRARVLASAAGQPAARVLSFPALIPWALAASLAVAATGASSLYLSKRSENTLLRGQQRLAQIEVASVRNQLEADRIVHQRELADARQGLAAAGRQLADSQKQMGEMRGATDQLRRQVENASRQVAALDQKLKSETDLAKYKIAALVSMLGNSPQAMAVAVWNPMEQQGMLKVSKLPMPAAGKDYQLWVFDPQYGSQPVNAGIFQMDPATGEAHVKFTASEKIMTPAKFAVSLEQKGGMPSPHGPIVLLSE